MGATPPGREPTPEERDVSLAEAEKARQETAKLAAETRSAEAAATKAEFELIKVVEAESERRASNKFHHIFVLEGAISDASVNECIQQLDTWDRVEPDCSITIRFYSPGGDVIAGMYLYDYLTGLKARGHRLTTEAYGYAASMAGILLQAGDVRRVGPESYILIHEIAFSVRGKVGEVEDEMEFVKKITERVLNIFAAAAERAKQNGTAEHALTKGQFKHRWSRKDWWLTSEEALDYGVVDEIA